ncbi:MAG: prolipoprotein diacylglyceryl transferase [Clostridia bacterium]|nr:prolipoprotein diacylglyceryl transferase [Clostridia bacterium]
MHPFIHIFGLNIPSYGLMMSLAFITAILISYFRVKKAGLDQDTFLNLAIISLVAGLISAYLLYIFVTYPIKEIFKSITSGSFYVFKNGGLVFYGGVIGGVLAALLYIHIKKQRFLDYAAVIVPTIPLAHAFGRIGCFLAGCCYGKVCETPISVFYKNPIGGAPIGVPVFPIQLIEAACNIVVFVILMVYVGKKLKKGSVIFLYMILYGIERFILEYFRFDEIRGIFLGLSTSQWISIFMVVTGIAGMIIMLKKERGSMLDASMPDAGSQDGRQALDEASTIAVESTADDAVSDAAEPVSGDDNQ